MVDDSLLTLVNNSISQETLKWHFLIFISVVVKGRKKSWVGDFRIGGNWGVVLYMGARDLLKREKNICEICKVRRGVNRGGKFEMKMGERDNFFSTMGTNSRTIRRVREFFSKKVWLRGLCNEVLIHLLVSA